MSGPKPVPNPKRLPSGPERQRLRGTLWQCPFCRMGFPLADNGRELIPVQHVLLKGLHPVGNLTGPDGRPLQNNVEKLVAGSVVRDIPILVPHIAMCIPAMRARGIKPELYFGVLLEPPGLVEPGAPTNDEQRKGEDDEERN